MFKHTPADSVVSACFQEGTGRLAHGVTPYQRIRDADIAGSSGPDRSSVYGFAHAQTVVMVRGPGSNEHLPCSAR